MCGLRRIYGLGLDLNRIGMSGRVEQLASPPIGTELPTRPDFDAWALPRACMEARNGRKK